MPQIPLRRLLYKIAEEETFCFYYRGAMWRRTSPQVRLAGARKWCYYKQTQGAEEHRRSQCCLRQEAILKPVPLRGRRAAARLKAENPLTAAKKLSLVLR